MFGIKSLEVLSPEGTKKGDPTTTLIYALRIITIFVLALPHLMILAKLLQYEKK